MIIKIGICVFLTVICLVDTDQDVLLFKFLTGDVAGYYGENAGSDYSEGVFPSSRFGSTGVAINEDEVVMFGGYGYHGTSRETRNDAWLYDIKKTNLNSLQVNPDTPILGPSWTKYRSFNESNDSGARWGSVAVFISAKNQVWIFGGIIGNVAREDVWLLDTHQYQWEKGSAVETNQKGVYGTKGEYGDSVNPGGRYSTTAWRANGEKSVMVFGGHGRASGNTFSYQLNDLWEYNLVERKWRWLNGLDTANPDGVVGQLDEYGETFMPSGRSAAIAFELTQSEAMIFGGAVRHGTTIMSDDVTTLHDIWIYSYSRNQFKIMKHSSANPLGTYETNYSPTNTIGGRTKHTGIKVSPREFLIFGGLGMGKYGVNNNWYGCRDDGGYLSDTWSLITTVSYCHGYFEYEPEVCSSHGTCINDTCICDENYFSPDCSVSRCREFLSNDTRVCSSHGICQSHDQCQCDRNYIHPHNDESESLPFCSITSCNKVLSNDTTGVCSGHGRCAFHDFCVCSGRFTGTFCGVVKPKTVFEQFWYLFTLVFPAIFLAFVIALILFCLFIYCIIKQRTKLKKFDGIDDIEILLQEKELEDTSSRYLKINKKLFEIDYSSMKILKILGEGGSGTSVYLVKWNDVFAAFKSFRFDDFGSQDDFDAFEKELSIYASLNHPNILQFFGAAVKLPRMGILTAYCENGDLKQFMLSFQGRGIVLPMQQKLTILGEVSSAMSYLHEKDIIHRDLKPENILIDRSYTSKIMDFGLSKVLDPKKRKETMTKRVGTLYYISPEVLLSSNYTNSCDVYSFAVIIWVVINGNFLPFGENDRTADIKVSQNPNYRPKINDLAFKECQWLKELMTKSWNFDPSERPTFKVLTERINKETVDLPKPKVESNDSLKEEIQRLKMELRQLKNKGK